MYDYVDGRSSLKWSTRNAQIQIERRRTESEREADSIGSDQKEK